MKIKKKRHDLRNIYSLNMRVIMTSTSLPPSIQLKHDGWVSELNAPFSYDKCQNVVGPALIFQ